MAAGSVPAPLMRTTARSVCSSVLMSSPLNSRPSARWTMTSSAPSTTWLLVSTMPDLSMITPEPMPSRGALIGRCMSLEIAAVEEVFEGSALERVFAAGAAMAAALVDGVGLGLAANGDHAWAWRLRRHCGRRRKALRHGAVAAVIDFFAWARRRSRRCADQQAAEPKAASSGRQDDERDLPRTTC